MKHRKQNVFLICILIGLLLLGCSQKQDGTGKDNSDKAKQPDLKVSNQSEVQTVEDKKKEIVVHVGVNMANGNYDPCTGFASEGFHIFHSALYKFNKDAKMEPDVATGYTVSEDKLKYTYSIRSDVKFSDGQPLTAEDVAFTYLTAKNSGSSVDLSKLIEAKALDEKTVEFTLSQPWSTFVSTAAQLGIVPKHAYGDDYKQKGIGSGPFKIVQLDIDQQLIIEPNEHYYGKPSEFKRITILNLDEQVALSAARSGTLDLVMINPEYANETIDGMNLVRLKTIDNRCISLPMVGEGKAPDGTPIGNPVTSDAAVRQALNIGINRVEIINNALNGVGVPAYGRVDSMPWNSDYTFVDNQREKALEILEDAGWMDSDGDGIREKDGIIAEFEVVADAGDLQRYQVAAAFAESAAPLGIKINAKALPWEEGVDKSKTEGFVWGFGDYNPSEFYYWYHSDARGVSYYNPSSYSSETADERINRALSAASEEDAIVEWKRLQYDEETGTGTEIDLPFIWIVNIDHTYFVRDGLSLGEQMIHPHGHGMPVLGNLNEWSFQ